MHVTAKAVAAFQEERKDMVPKLVAVRDHRNLQVGRNQPPDLSTCKLSRYGLTKLSTVYIVNT
jgi:hypothetical protein